ncbi:LysM peptidoglycan-binding domain-containing protein [Crocinitomicaceae bacterium]|nr:LysM peptidoglycan-binding domain-containing protein [Crocinitomicaceae bacterium]
MRTIIFLFVLLSSSLSFAQPGVAPQKEVGGVMSYIHTVEPGNTLWGLQQMYGVKVEDIMSNNSNLNEGLSVGQKIIIPVPNYVKPLPETSKYKVKKGETLYGLSRKFNTTVDELIKINPELSKGLKKGQLIQVPGKIESEIAEEIEPEIIDEPVPNPFVADTILETQETVTVSFSDSIVRHNVMSHETMYSISKRFMVSIEKIMEINKLSTTRLSEGQVLVIPVKSERITKVPVKPVPDVYEPDDNEPLIFEIKERYKIAVILPLHLDYGPGYSKYVSSVATQFYMGALMALDSLKAMGLNADVHFFDSKNDSAAVQALVNGSEFLDVDLVIGPFFSKTQAIVAEYCKNNKIRMVCPVSSESKLLEKNRLVYASVPSNITLVTGLAQYVLRTHAKDKIILVKSTDKDDLPLYEAFRKSFNESPMLGEIRPALRETTIDGMKSYLDRSSKNIIIIPTLDKTTGVRFMNTLNRSSFKAKPDEIYVFGMKEWVDFTDINNIYKNKFNLHFGSPNFVDYYTDEMIELNRTFRREYNTDMSKMAVQAYDVFLFYCSNFLLENQKPNLMMNNFRMEQFSESDGYENQNVFILEQEEYELRDSENRIND